MSTWEKRKNKIAYSIMVDLYDQYLCRLYQENKRMPEEITLPKEFKKLLSWCPNIEWVGEPPKKFPNVELFESSFNTMRITWI